MICQVCGLDSRASDVCEWCNASFISHQYLALSFKADTEPRTPLEANLTTAAGEGEADTMAIPSVPAPADLLPGAVHAAEAPVGAGADAGAAQGPVRRVALTGEVFESPLPPPRPLPTDLQLPVPGRDDSQAPPGGPAPGTGAPRKPVEEPQGKGWRRIMGR